MPVRHPPDARPPITILKEFFCEKHVQNPCPVAPECNTWSGCTLLLIQQFQTPQQMDMLKFLDKYGKGLKCQNI